MPEIQSVDRERFQEWHDFDATLAPISGDDKQRLLESYAAHREAGHADGAKAVLKMMRELANTLGDGDGESNLAVRVKAIAILRAADSIEPLLASQQSTTTTTPPEPRALTAEIVKEMLPANHIPINAAYYPWARYKSPIGVLLWYERNPLFIFEINGKPTSLKDIGTRSAFASLIAAFGIDAGVKHG